MTVRGRNNHQAELPGLAAEPAGARAEPATASAIPHGYKQTEVGVIPVEWEITSLGNHVRITSGESPSLIHFTTGGKPYFKVEQLGNGEKYLGSGSTPYHFLNGKTVPRNSVIFAKRGAAISLNRIRVLSDDAFMDTNLMALTPADDLEPEFLYYGLGHIGLWRFADTTSIPQINNKHVKPLCFPLPPLPEQRAIAAALSDVDSLLGALERLLAKKRDLKQAAMQQLLTGQQRLPGFAGKWETKRLGEVVDTDPENLGSETRSDFLFNYIALEDVDRGFLRSHSEQLFASAPSRARRKLRPNDVLVSTVRPNLQSHLFFGGEAGRWVCSTGFCVVRCREGVTHPAYVFFHLFASCVNRQIETLLTGSNYPAINSGDVRALRIPFPDYSEQAAIAAVLSDMDAELAALAARRDKTRALKQGMMQELLTGRVRLVGA